jgi:hypothetical protein
MTGPNLPANGVTLPEISLRADQGDFTTVDLNSNQEWSFKWNTARLLSHIDPGTYTVYITTEAVDLSHLGGRSTYKTLSVYLQDAGISQGSSEPGTYTLNPEKHSSSISAVPSMIIATPAPTLNQSTPIPVATIFPSAVFNSDAGRDVTHNPCNCCRLPRPSDSNPAFLLITWETTIFRE